MVLKNIIFTSVIPVEINKQTNKPLLALRWGWNKSALISLDTNRGLEYPRVHFGTQTRVWTGPGSESHPNTEMCHPHKQDQFINLYKSTHPDSSCLLINITHAAGWREYEESLNAQCLLHHPHRLPLITTEKRLNSSCPVLSHRVTLRTLKTPL